jgi:ABC-type dipeptide/oligopeptide/nickel transport system permease component
VAADGGARAPLCHASLIRIMRANLLDELHKPYVDTARAKGLSEFWLIMKYPCGGAEPVVSTIGWVLPNLVSGAGDHGDCAQPALAGPLMLQALLSQDMYLAGAFVLLLSLLTVIGMLISDILLVLLDPRFAMTEIGSPAGGSQAAGGPRPPQGRARRKSPSLAMAAHLVGLQKHR